MGCEPLNRTIYGSRGGFLCSKGSPRSKKCAGCGQKRALRECDAHVGTMASDTCDAPICDHCASHVDGLDLDLCPLHANQPTPPGECLADASYRKERKVRRPEWSPAPLQPCEGAIIYPQCVCLRHLRLFDRWLRSHNGWKDFYSKPDDEVSRDDKRKAFHSWLDSQPAEARA